MSTSTRQNSDRRTTRLTFSQHLIGQGERQRPRFLYAYLGMWGHLLASSLLLLWTGRLQLEPFAALVVASLCLGIVLYGLLARQWSLLINLLGYAAGVSRLFYPERCHPQLLALVILIALSSAYLLLSQEYRHYRQKVAGDSKNRGFPLWIEVAMGLAIGLLCLYGLALA